MFYLLKLFKQNGIYNTVSKSLRNDIFLMNNILENFPNIPNFKGNYSDVYEAINKIVDTYPDLLSCYSNLEEQFMSCYNFSTNPVEKFILAKYIIKFDGIVSSINEAAMLSKKVNRKLKWFIDAHLI